MGTTIDGMKAAHAWQAKHDLAAPKVGDQAPDFELRGPDGEGPIRLSELCETQPVALVFGSFT